MFNDTILSPFDGLFSAPPKGTPTDGVPDGPIAGNGDIGLSFGLQDGLLKGFIGKNDLWCAAPDQFGGGVKSVGAFALQFPGLDGAAFSARQALTTADIEITLKTEACALRLDSYVPYTENAVCFRLTCESGSTFVRTDLIAPDYDKCRIRRRTTETQAHLHKAFEDPAYAFATLADASLSRSDGGKLCFPLFCGESVSFVLTVRTNHDGTEKAQREFEPMRARKEHLSFWKGFWSKSRICIPSEKNIERYWYGSQYIMACACKADSFAPGLFGPFITTDHAGWAGDYHLNYNYQAPWWGVFSSNHVELAEPYDRPLLEYLPKARKNAKELLGCRGIYSAVGIGPMGYESAAMFRKDGTPDRETPFWGQKSNAAYAAVNMLLRFYATWDADYAREKAYPYCREVADFWEDYLRWDGKRYVIERDCIHENAFLAHRDDPSFPDYSEDFNPLLSLGLVRMVFCGVLKMSEALCVDAERREKWQHILDHLSDYPTQIRSGKEVFRYTERGMDWCESNSLGIQHVYPARGIGLSSDEKLLQIARDTLTELSRWEDYNAFPTFFPAAVYLGYDPDDLLRRLNRELRVHGFENLFVYYGGGGLECASTVPATINNMFLQSHEEALRLFPVWNPNIPASFENLRAEGAFLVSGEVKDGKIGPVTVFSEKGRELRVLCPWKSGMKIVCEGKEVPCRVESVRDGKIFTFKTCPGASYQLSEA